MDPYVLQKGRESQGETDVIGHHRDDVTTALTTQIAMRLKIQPPIDEEGVDGRQPVSQRYRNWVRQSDAAKENGKQAHVDEEPEPVDDAVADEGDGEP